jgi:hypothetical protein
MCSGKPRSKARKQVAFLDCPTFYNVAKVDRRCIAVTRITAADEAAFESIMCSFEDMGTKHVQKHIKPHRLKINKRMTRCWC